MIKRVAIRNFQAHKETNLDLSPGLNCLIGSSDNGKSSVIRSLLWAYNNRPLGMEYISYWNRNKKGEPKGESSVEIEFNNGILKRERTPECNGYSVNDDTYGAIGTDVPEQVMSLFNITDLNISSQHDKPFLISETAGDVAKYLNKLVKLDKIDEVLANVESKRREVKKEADLVEKQIETSEKDMARHTWIEEGEKIYQALEKKNEVLVGYDRDIVLLQDTLISALSARSVLDVKKEQAANLDKSQEIIKEYETLVLAWEGESNQVQILAQALVEARLAQSNATGKAIVPDRLIEKIETEREYMEDMKRKTDSLSEIIIQLRNQWDTMETTKAKIKEALKDLPKLCPACERPLENCND